ncbi:MAG: radical SAM protein [Deltaproteobacteria bacterium]|nr:radical SAM protein [Deltaproteobacteria bacterium]
MTLLVNEIFYSIQGESIHSGRPCIFVRLTGCNLRCSYCDTRYAYEQGVNMEITEIINRIAAHRCRLVEITGGEPLLQSQSPILIYRLLENGYEVMLETNGSLDISRVDGRCIKIVDIKCPTSGESDKNDLGNLKRLGSKDQVKFVIGDRSDYKYAKVTMDSISPDFPEEQILFSPASGGITPSQLAEWILEDSLNVRLHLQLHKIIWPDKERGV